MQSIREMAENLLRSTPAVCTSGQLAAVLGVHFTAVNKQLKRRQVPVLRTPGGHRRIPRNVQVTIVSEYLRRGIEG